MLEESIKNPPGLNQSFAPTLINSYSLAIKNLMNTV